MIFSASCIEKSKPSRKHDSSVLDEVQTQKTQIASQYVFHKSNIHEVQKQLFSYLDQNGESAEHSLVLRSFVNLNQMWISEMTSGKLDQNLQKLLLEYYDRVLKGCEVDLTHCSQIQFFSTAASSSTVILKGSSLVNLDLSVKMNLLLLALQIKGKTFDFELSMNFLKVATEYNQSLSAVDSRKKTLVSIIESILLQVQKRNQENEIDQVIKILKLNESGTREFWIQSGIDKGVLITLTSNSSLDQGWFLNNRSLRVIYDEIKSKRPRQLQIFENELSIEWSHTLMLMDKAFVGEITVRQAAELLEKSRASAKEIENSVYWIYSIRFLEALSRSNEKAQRFFNAQQVPGSQFLTHAIQSGAQSQSIWDELSVRVSTLKSLALIGLKDGHSIQKHADNIRQKLDAHPRNVKMIAVFPQMLAISYHLSKRKSKHVAYGFFGKIELDSKKILQNMYWGLYGSWFSYSTDIEALNMVELLYSFEAALKSGVFEGYNVDPDDFVAEISERLIEEPLESVEKARALLNTRINSAQFNEFKRICTDIKTQSYKPVLDLDGLPLSPLLGHLRQSIFTQMSSKGSIQARNGKGQIEESGLMIFDDHVFNKAAEEVRLDLGNIQFWISALQNSYKNYLIKNKMNIDIHLGESAKVLSKLKSVRIDFLRQAILLYKEYSKCYLGIYNFERKIQTQLIQREEEYLRQAFRDIKEIRKDPRRTIEFQRKYRFHQFGNYQGQDQIGADGMTYHQADTLLRFSLHLTHNWNWNGHQWNSILPGSHVNLGQMDQENDILSNPKGDSFRYLYIPFQDDEELFVRQGLRRLINESSGFVFWYVKTADGIREHVQRIHAGLILYRANEPDLVKSVCTDWKYCSSPSELISAEDIISVQRQALDELKIDGEERRLLTLVQQPRRMPILNLDRFLLSYDFVANRVGHFWGLYDLPLRMVTAPNLGLGLSVAILAESSGRDLLLNAMAGKETLKHYSYVRLGDLYFSVRGASYRQSLLIKPSAALDSFLDHGIRQFIQAELSRVKQFHIELANERDVLLNQKPEFRPRVDVYLHQSLESPVFQDQLVDSFDKWSVQFHRKTGGCYKSSQCDDFNLVGHN